MTTGYESLSIAQFNELVDVMQDREATEFDRQVSMIAIVNGMTEQEVLGLSLEKYSESVASLYFLEKPIPKARPRAKAEMRIGVWDCDVVVDMRRMTTAQYIDFQELSKEGRKGMHRLLSVFLVPKGKSYNKGYDMEKLQQDILEQMSIVEANDLYAFFLAELHSSIDNIADCLAREIRTVRDKEKRRSLQMQMRQLKKDLRRLGDGYPALIESPRLAAAAGTPSGI